MTMSTDLPAPYYPRCKTCKWRVVVKAAGLQKDYSVCRNPKIGDGWAEPQTDDLLRYEYMEGGEFKVGESFGCVHHQVSEVV